MVAITRQVRTFHFTRLVWLVLWVALAGCGGGKAESEKVDTRPRAERIAEAELSVLFIGNSHTGLHDVPGLFAFLVQSDQRGTRVFAEGCTGSPFLADHAQNAVTRETIAAGRWSFVVLQAQKYSMSGKFFYPYDGAIELARLAQQQGAQVIMFPEWPRRGVDETDRVHHIHEEIAQKVEARVAPVGWAWEQALELRPEMALYSDDGNHSSPSGAYLTACVLYATITGRDPRGLPAPPRLGLESDERKTLQQAAWMTVAERAGDGSDSSKTTHSSAKNPSAANE